ncbi:MAG: hypothetical protein HYY06_17340 [Deltaproteobacteria bacterium]|nr:hypothetical protein [Deltaproteobacteria bacterium]
MRILSRWKALSMLLAGFLAGVAFVIACGSARRGSAGGDDDVGGDGGFFGAPDAHAQEGAVCARWEVVLLAEEDLEETGEEVSPRDDDAFPNTVLLGPSDWEPFAWDAGGMWYSFRRCAR